MSWNNYSNHMHDVTINQLLIHNYTKYNTRTRHNKGLYIHLDHTMYHVNVLLTNSKFHIMDQSAFLIRNRFSLTTKQIYIINCMFELISSAFPAIDIRVSPFNKTVSFINCEFLSNTELIKITIRRCRSLFDCELIINNAMMLTNISFVRCQFIKNKHRIMLIENKDPKLGKVNVLLESLVISQNDPRQVAENSIISITAMNVHINDTDF